MTLTAAFVAFVNAVIAVITVFGVNLNAQQIGTISLAVNAGCVLAALVYDKVRGIKPTALPTPNGSPSG